MVADIINQSGSGSNGIKGVTTSPKGSELKLHHQIQFNVIPRTLFTVWNLYTKLITIFGQIWKIKFSDIYIVFFFTISRSGRMAEIRWSVCISKSQDGFLVVHIPFVCMVKFELLAQFPVDHLSIHSCLTLYIFSLIYCIRLLCDWLFCLYHYIIYICYFITSCLFLIWQSLRRCFVLLSEEIQFLY